jgi:hypothetical protein
VTQNAQGAALVRAKKKRPQRWLLTPWKGSTNLGTVFLTGSSDQCHAPSRTGFNRPNAEISRNNPELPTVSNQAGEEFLMTEDQIADLEDDELAMHICRVQQINSADRELAELLHERRRRQILAVVSETVDDDQYAELGGG